MLVRNNTWDQRVLQNWAEGFVDRDGKFVKELQTSFNSSFWELYLFACLKRMGFETDFSFRSPDFVASRGWERLCIEATTANNAEGTKEEWERELTAEALEAIDRRAVVDSATFRLANALSAKYRKYVADYAKLAHVKNIPFVIAIAPFDQPYFWVQNDQAMRRVLYGFDEFDYKDFPEENRREVYGFTTIEYIEKPNGTRIPLGFFKRPEMPEISAVLFSNTATLGKIHALNQDPNPYVLFESLRYNDDGLRPHHRIQPKAEYSETLLDGLKFFHNPHAMYPLDPNRLDFPGVAHEICDEDGKPGCRTPDEFLIQRSVVTMIPVDDDSETATA
jgi:hypothetical protein